MSDDEADPELLELLRQHLQGKPSIKAEPETGVLESAEAVYDDSIDVAIDMRATKAAAAGIYSQMQLKSYSTASWNHHELHPDTKDEATLALIFTIDLLNFSFWSELPDDERFSIEYRGKRWTGYWSLVAALQRALDEGVPITSPEYWQSEEDCTLESLRHILRSATDEEMPLLQERLMCLREAGQVLCDQYDGSVANLVEAAGGSAAELVNILAEDFPCFRDEHSFGGRKKPVRILKRAQIFVADVWACFDGEGFGEFRDIDKITIFADYRVPQILNIMGCLYYSPPLATKIASKELIENGSRLELQLRGECPGVIRRHPRANKQQRVASGASSSSSGRSSGSTRTPRSTRF